MDIRVAASDTDILACQSVLRELRPHMPEDELLARVRSQEKTGYRLACLRETGEPVAVAGFRIAENLAWGRFLYLDDLVTSTGHRSRGYGAAMLAWLKDYARQHECTQLHSDTGLQRKDAHRFYQSRGMTASGLHFYTSVAAAPE